MRGGTEALVGDGEGVLAAALAATLVVRSDQEAGIEAGLSAVLAVIVGLAYVGSGLVARRQLSNPRIGAVMTFIGFAWFATFLAYSNDSLLFTVGTAMEEVAGGAAVLVDPLDVASIADGVREAQVRRQESGSEQNDGEDGNGKVSHARNRIMPAAPAVGRAPCSPCGHRPAYSRRTHPSV